LLARDLGKIWRTLVILVLVASLFLLMRSSLRGILPRRRGGGAGSRRKSAAGQPGVEFYSRLERLLGRSGWTRDVAQTQREFAHDSARRLAHASGSACIVPLALQVVEAFYQVRFGRAPLAPEQAGAVEQALRTIRQAARNGHGKRGRLEHDHHDQVAAAKPGEDVNKHGSGSTRRTAC
jgi:hypothetical protein